MSGFHGFVFTRWCDKHQSLHVEFHITSRPSILQTVWALLTGRAIRHRTTLRQMISEMSHDVIEKISDHVEFDCGEENERRNVVQLCTRDGERVH